MTNQFKSTIFCNLASVQILYCPIEHADTIDDEFRSNKQVLLETMNFPCISTFSCLFVLPFFAMVSSELSRETNLCKICDRSSLTPHKSSETKNKCFRYGTYDVFCHPDFFKINRNEYNKIHECESLFSVYPPQAPNRKCSINIQDNHGNIQDIVTITNNVKISSTNNSWYIKPQKHSDSFAIGIAKRIESQKHFEGN